MADEVRNANVVVLTRAPGGGWAATVGPDARSGLEAVAPTPALALIDLAALVHVRGWLCDPDFRPGRATFHDA